MRPTMQFTRPSISAILDESVAFIHISFLTHHYLIRLTKVFIIITQRLIKSFKLLDDSPETVKVNILRNDAT